LLYRFQQVEVDAARQVVKVGGAEVTCQPRVYQLLLLLCAAGGAVVTREEIFARLWEGQQVPSDESLTQLVHRLRATLGPGSGVVRTVRGVGFRLDCAVEQVAARAAGEPSPFTPQASAVPGEAAAAATRPATGDPARPASRSGARWRRRWWALPPVLAAGAAVVWLSLARPWQLIDGGYALQRGDLAAQRRQTADLVARAFAAERIGDRSQARHLLEIAHTTDAGTPVPAAFLSLFSRWRSGGEAEGWARAAGRRLRPSSSPYLHLLVRYVQAAAAEGRDGDWVAADSALLALRPSAWLLRLARAHYNLSRREEGAALADLRQIPIPALNDHSLALVLADRASLGDVEGAARDLESSRLRGEEALAWYVRGRIARSRRRAAEARDAFDRELATAIRRNEPDLVADARLLGALAACEQGDLADAAARLELTATQARAEGRSGTESDALGLEAYLAWRRGDAAVRDQRLAEAAGLHAAPEWPNRVSLALLALWMGAPPPEEPGALAARLPREPELTGLGDLLLGRRAFAAGDWEQARRRLRQARESGIGRTWFMEEADLLAADLGEPPRPQWIDPPYPNLLRFAAAQELNRRLGAGPAARRR
jgi:DNA-binding winged helix-turn-helix (wHTH) protein